MSQRTIDPQLTNLNLFYKKDFYKQATNYLDTIESYETELEQAIKFNKTKVSNDVIKAQTDFFVELDNRLKSMSPQFAAYWINQFNRSLEAVRNEVLIKNNGGTFYQNFSDCIGSLTKQENYYDDSTQLVSDVSGDDIMAPLRYGASLTNKISTYTQLLHAEMSKKVNLVFRKNIKNIQEKISTSTQPHGDNLVPDSRHFERIQNIVSSLNQKLRQQFKELYGVIELYSSYNSRSSSNNIQFVPNIDISVDIEGTPINQDILFNRVQEIRSQLTTKGLLGAN
jgi:hypothetical protein